jgi:hypothetical protein
MRRISPEDGVIRADGRARDDPAPNDDLRAVVAELRAVLVDPTGSARRRGRRLGDREGREVRRCSTTGDLIGNLGYPDRRRYGTTPVYCLDVDNIDDWSWQRSERDDATFGRMLFCRRTQRPLRLYFWWEAHVPQSQSLIANG